MGCAVIGGAAGAGAVVVEQVDAVQQGFQCFVEFVGRMVLGQFGFQAFQPRVLG